MEIYFGLCLYNFDGLICSYLLPYLALLTISQRFTKYQFHFSNTIIRALTQKQRNKKDGGYTEDIFDALFHPSDISCITDSKK